MADRYLLESSAVDGYQLEDGSGVLLLELPLYAFTVPVSLYNQVQRKRYINSDTSQDAWILSVPVVTAETRTPLLFNQQKQRGINEIDYFNLLESTLSQLPTVQGTVNYTNLNDTSSAQGSPIGIGSLARTNNNDTSSGQGTPIVPGSLARTNANDTSVASGTTIVVGSLNYTNNNDTLAASGSVTPLTNPFTPVFTQAIQRRSINTILYGSRGVNAQPPVVQADPVRPDLFTFSLRKPNRFAVFDAPNLLTTVLEFQPIASAYPETVFLQRRVFAVNMDFPNLVVKGVPTGIIGTLSYTNNNDTSTGTGNVTVLGSLAKTNANDTSVASGSPAVSGNLARTNTNDTSTGQGTTTIQGSVAKTNNDDTLAASGSVVSVPTGTVAYTNNSDSLSAQGTVVDTGSLNKTNNNDTLSAFGTAGTTSGITTRLPMTGVGS